MGATVTASIELVDTAGARQRADVQGTCTWNRNGPNCELTLNAGELTLTASGPDYFEAFCRIREELDKSGLVPFCYGASRYVWPSGMCRDMGLGRKAYNGRIGQRLTSNDLVGIFETGPDVEPVTVAEQRAYAAAAWEAARTR